MTRLAPVRAGDVIQVAEENDYYGLGSMTLRITKVHGLLYLDGGPLVMVDGIPLWSRGYEGEERYAQIRVEAIRLVPRQSAAANRS